MVVKQTNSNWVTFDMFNIIKTPRNYFTRQLLHNNLSSNMALHFSVSHWWYLMVSCLEEVFCQPSTAPVVQTEMLETAEDEISSITLLN